MSQVNGIDKPVGNNEIQPVLYPNPNQLVAMSLYYPPLVPALVGLCILVLVAVFSRDFPRGFLFWNDLSLQGIIAALSVLSAFLFLEAARMGYFAHSNDLYGMDKERRKSIFQGNDPFQEGLQNTAWFNWKAIKEKAEVITKRYVLRAAGYFILGLVTLFFSVSFLLASYIFWLGIGTFVLTCMYTIFQYEPLKGMVKEYRRLTKRFRELEDKNT